MTAGLGFAPGCGQARRAGKVQRTFPAKAIGMSAPEATDQTHAPTALLVLGDGTVLKGRGLGAEGKAVGEVCFNTSMTGYQEIMTDPSYAGQIINFTFPHIGNVGANEEDIESVTPAARGCVLAVDITAPSS